MPNRTKSSENRATYQTVSRNRKLLIIVGIRLHAQNVALAPAGVKQAAAETRVQLGAEALDVHVDHIRERIEVLVPYVLRDLLAAHHPALVEHQELDQGVFLGGKARGSSGARNGVAGGGRREVGGAPHHGGERRGWAA